MKLTVLGAGSWGLTLTWLLAHRFDRVSLWGRAQSLDDELVNTKCCAKPVSVQLASSVMVTSDLSAAIDGADIVLNAVATKGVREVCQQLKVCGVKSEQILLNASKGLELPSLMRMSEVIHEVLPEQKVAVLSGPTIAKEVLDGKPTAACVASVDMATAKMVQQTCSVNDRFRLYTNCDVVGVELGGSLKNVIAIAAGLVHALKLGDNCLAAMLTRGIAEIARISVRLGADLQTIYGLAGLGDLITTCTSSMSRNYTVGFMLGCGKKLTEILANLGAVAEGVNTARAVYLLVQQLGLETPILQAVYQLLYTDIDPYSLISQLMNRKLIAEDRGCATT